MRKRGAWAIPGLVLLALGILLVTPACESRPIASATTGATTTAQTHPPTTVPAMPPTTASAVVRATVGESVQGRPIDVYSAGLGATRVLLIGGIHGDETGSDVALALIRYLKAHPSAIPRGVALDIIPVVNPDGEAADTRGNARQVDINRNFPSGNWSAKLRGGDGPSKGLSGGETAGSEPETRAILTCLERGYSLVIALHSQGGLIDFDGPGGEAIARRMSESSGLPVRHLAYQQQVTGSLGIFVPERYGIPVITVELEDSELSPRLRSALLHAAG